MSHKKGISRILHSTLYLVVILWFFGMIEYFQIDSGINLNKKDKTSKLKDNNGILMKRFDLLCYMAGAVDQELC